MAVDVKTGPGGAFQGGAPKALFNPQIGVKLNTLFDVTNDGRFLIPAVLSHSGAVVTVLVNWPWLLKK